MAEIADESAGQRPSPRPDWDWVERAVWTDRMLNALQRGVMGGKWHNLIDKVYAPRNLQRAYEAVAANRGSGGVDGVTVAGYERELRHNQEVLAKQLRSGTYRPQPVRRIYIDKPGSTDKRPLGIPCVRDRIAQRALKQVIEPIYEATFHAASFGFRPKLGCKDALRELDGLLKTGYTVVVDADIRGFFDAIPKDLLMARVRKEIADGRVLDLIEDCLHQGVMEEMACWDPETGTPQGAVVSPLLANIFLNPFDWAMDRAGIRIVRYADDFVMLCRTRLDAERALESAREWMTANRLELHPTKTRLVDMAEEGAEFSFLGYRFKRHTSRQGRSRILKLVSRKSTGKLRDTIRSHTNRCNAHSMPEIIRRINLTLRGWFNYFQHCFAGELTAVDQYVRRRLRRILRKRARCGRGQAHNHGDHIRWPNAFFHELGYFSLAAARDRAVQSLRGTR